MSYAIFRRTKNKLSERVTSAGRISVASSVDAVAIVELNCETDFVARNESFEAVVSKIASTLLASSTGSRTLTVDEAKAATHDGTAVQALLNGALTTLGENVVLRRAAVVRVAGGAVGGYVHAFGSYGALVALQGKDGTALVKADEAAALASKLAQHIVAQDPGACNADGLKKLSKQQFVFDPSMNIAQLLVKTSKQLGEPLAVAQYIRWKCGADA